MSLQQNILVFSIWKGWNEREFLFQATSKLAWHKTGDVKEHSCFMGGKNEGMSLWYRNSNFFWIMSFYWIKKENKKKRKKVLILRAPFFLYKTMKVKCQGTLCLSISFGANYRYMKCLLIISTVCKKKEKNIIFYTSPIFPQTLK